jgi:hypothetical protein
VRSGRVGSIHHSRSQTMNTPTTGEIRPNSADNTESKGILSPLSTHIETEFNTLSVRIDAVYSTLRLLTGSSQGGEFDDGVEGVLAGLNILLEAAQTAWSDLNLKAAGLVYEADNRMVAFGILLEQASGILWVLQQYCQVDRFTSDSVHPYSALCGIQSLISQTKTELDGFMAWAATVAIDAPLCETEAGHD